MSQITRKWIADNAVNRDKIDDADTYTVAGLNATVSLAVDSTAPRDALHIRGTTDGSVGVRIDFDGASGRSYQIMSTSDGSMTFQDADVGATRMIIGPTGIVKVGMFQLGDSTLFSSFSTDVGLGGVLASDTATVSQKAIKTYVDAHDYWDRTGYTLNPKDASRGIIVENLKIQAGSDTPSVTAQIRWQSIYGGDQAWAKIGDAAIPDFEIGAIHGDTTFGTGDFATNLTLSSPANFTFLGYGLNTPMLLEQSPGSATELSIEAWGGGSAVGIFDIYAPSWTEIFFWSGSTRAAPGWPIGTIRADLDGGHNFTFRSDGDATFSANWFGNSPRGNFIWRSNGLDNMHLTRTPSGGFTTLDVLSAGSSMMTASQNPSGATTLQLSATNGVTFNLSNSGATVGNSLFFISGGFFNAYLQTVPASNTFNINSRGDTTYFSNNASSFSKGTHTFMASSTLKYMTMDFDATTYNNSVYSFYDRGSSSYVPMLTLKQNDIYAGSIAGPYVLQLTSRLGYDAIIAANVIQTGGTFGIPAFYLSVNSVLKAGITFDYGTNLLDINSVGNIRLHPDPGSGHVQIYSLSGSGTRAVYADTNGILQDHP